MRAAQLLNGPADPGRPLDITVEEFAAISELLHQACGILLGPTKQPLVRARLWSRLRDLGLHSFSEYLARLRADLRGEELLRLVDALATNKTEFFREARHIEFLTSELAPSIREGRAVRIWSAGCSSGEEPYSVAMALLEGAPDPSRADLRVLGTDISSRALALARAGRYPADALRGMSERRRGRFFVRDPASPGEYTVAALLRERVRFARLNLIGPWPMKGPFDAIFCRNVMIYFERATHETLVRRFREYLRPGGLLFIGHAETLAGSQGDYSYVMPAVYRR